MGRKARVQVPLALAQDFACGGSGGVPPSPQGVWQLIDFASRFGTAS